MPIKNIIVLFVSVVLIVVAIFYLESKKAHVPTENIQGVSLALSGDTSTGDNASSSLVVAKSTLPPPTASEIAATRAQKALKYPAAVEIVDPSGFVNTPDGKPIKIADYIGKNVILVDFMTYSCINCQRTFPYLNAWYTKYKDKGLVIIGIHTPEFAFEKDYNNVKTQLARFGIKFPVVLDNNYGTWTAYQNQYWPRKYLIDIDGRIVEDHIGEGGYAETEQEIQKLLIERDARLGIVDNMDSSIVNPSGTSGAIVAQSGETYFGSNRNKYLANGTVGKSGLQNFTVPTSGLVDNALYLGGSWNVGTEYATSVDSESSMTYVFNAKNVFFVAAAKNPSSPVVAEVNMDGAPVPTAMRGSDIYESAGKTYVKVGDPRLYEIVKGTKLERHTLKIQAQGSGLEAFTLTFG